MLSDPELDNKWANLAPIETTLWTFMCLGESKCIDANLAQFCPKSDPADAKPGHGFRDVVFIELFHTFWRNIYY